MLFSFAVAMESCFCKLKIHCIQCSRQRCFKGEKIHLAHRLTLDIMILVNAVRDSYHFRICNDRTTGNVSLFRAGMMDCITCLQKVPTV